MDPLTARLVVEWLNVDRASQGGDDRMVAQDALLEGRPDDARTILENLRVRWGESDVARAIERVRLVLSGEVRWSEASEADRAIWSGRLRNLTNFVRWWRQDDIGEDDLDSALKEAQATLDRRSLAGDPRYQRAGRGRRYEEWWANYWDTVHFPDRRRGGVEPQNGTRLFGNSNIGNRFLCNLQVPGQTGSDQHLAVHAFYVTCSNTEALGWLANQVVFMFIVGSVPRLTVRGYDAYAGIPLYPPRGRPVFIPPRQNFACQVEWYQGEPPDEIRPFSLVVHLEGLESWP